jgi:hypothetical protein
VAQSEAVSFTRPHRVDTGGASQHTTWAEERDAFTTHGTAVPSTTKLTRVELVNVPRWVAPVPVLALVAETPFRQMVALSLTVRDMVPPATALTTDPVLFTKPTSASQGYTTFLHDSLRVHVCSHEEER